MRAQALTAVSEQTTVLVFEKGDEPVQAITDFARKEKLGGSETTTGESRSTSRSRCSS